MSRFSLPLIVMVTFLSWGASSAQESANAKELADVKAELSSLREEVAKLQQMLDTFLNKTVADLRSENERLRQEVKRLYKSGNVTLPDVPMPDRTLLEEAVGEAGRESVPGGQQPVAKKKGKKSPTDEPQDKAATVGDESRVKAGEELAYDVTAEWGRSPQEAAELAKNDPKAASLKGMICVVAQEADEASLIALARSLREQCDAYDNINIEVFNDGDAARSFNENRGGTPQHRVLSISKHKGSGRDLIVLFKGDKAVPVPPKP